MKEQDNPFAKGISINEDWLGENEEVRIMFDFQQLYDQNMKEYNAIPPEVRQRNLEIHLSQTLKHMFLINPIKETDRAGLALTTPEE